MLDYIKKRIEAIRNEKVIDFLSKYTYSEGDSMSHLYGNSKVIEFNANRKKNMKSSRVKQTGYEQEKHTP